MNTISGLFSKVSERIRKSILSPEKQKEGQKEGGDKEEGTTKTKERKGKASATTIEGAAETHTNTVIRNRSTSSVSSSSASDRTSTKSSSQRRGKGQGGRSKVRERGTNDSSSGTKKESSTKNKKNTEDEDEKETKQSSSSDMRSDMKKQVASLFSNVEKRIANQAKNVSMSVPESRQSTLKHFLVSTSRETSTDIKTTSTSKEDKINRDWDKNSSIIDKLIQEKEKEAIERWDRNERDEEDKENCSSHSPSLSSKSTSSAFHPPLTTPRIVTPRSMPDSRTTSTQKTQESQKKREVGQERLSSKKSSGVQKRPKSTTKKIQSRLEHHPDTSTPVLQKFLSKVNTKSNSRDNLKEDQIQKNQSEEGEETNDIMEKIEVPEKIKFLADNKTKNDPEPKDSKITTTTTTTTNRNSELTKDEDISTIISTTINDTNSEKLEEENIKAKKGDNDLLNKVQTDRDDDYLSRISEHKTKEDNIIRHNKKFITEDDDQLEQQQPYSEDNINDEIAFIMNMEAEEQEELFFSTPATISSKRNLVSSQDTFSPMRLTLSPNKIIGSSKISSDHSSLSYGLSGPLNDIQKVDSPRKVKDDNKLMKTSSDTNSLDIQKPTLSPAPKQNLNLHYSSENVIDLLDSETESSSNTGQSSSEKFLGGLIEVNEAGLIEVNEAGLIEVNEPGQHKINVNRDSDFDSSSSSSYSNSSDSELEIIESPIKKKNRTFSIRDRKTPEKQIKAEINSGSATKKKETKRSATETNTIPLSSSDEEGNIQNLATFLEETSALQSKESSNDLLNSEASSSSSYSSRGLKTERNRSTTSYRNTDTKRSLSMEVANDNVDLPYPKKMELARDLKTKKPNSIEARKRAKQNFSSKQEQLYQKTEDLLKRQRKNTIGRRGVSILKKENFFLDVPPIIESELKKFRECLQNFYQHVQNDISKANDHNVDRVMLEWRGHEKILAVRLMETYKLYDNRELTQMNRLGEIIGKNNLTPVTARQLKQHPYFLLTQAYLLQDDSLEFLKMHLDYTDALESQSTADMENGSTISSKDTSQAINTSTAASKLGSERVITKIVKSVKEDEHKNLKSAKATFTKDTAHLNMQQESPVDASKNIVHPDSSQKQNAKTKEKEIQKVKDPDEETWRPATRDGIDWEEEKRFRNSTNLTSKEAKLYPFRLMNAPPSQSKLSVSLMIANTISYLQFYYQHIKESTGMEISNTQKITANESKSEEKHYTLQLPLPIPFALPSCPSALISHIISALRNPHSDINLALRPIYYFLNASSALLHYDSITKQYLMKQSRQSSSLLVRTVSHRPPNEVVIALLMDMIGSSIYPSPNISFSSDIVTNFVKLRDASSSFSASNNPNPLYLSVNSNLNLLDILYLDKNTWHNDRSFDSLENDEDMMHESSRKKKQRRMSKDNSQCAEKRDAEGNKLLSSPSFEGALNNHTTTCSTYDFMYGKDENPPLKAIVKETNDFLFRLTRVFAVLKVWVYSFPWEVTVLDEQEGLSTGNNKGGRNNSDSDSDSDRDMDIHMANKDKSHSQESKKRKKANSTYVQSKEQLVERKELVQFNWSDRIYFEDTKVDDLKRKKKKAKTNQSKESESNLNDMIQLENQRVITFVKNNNSIHHQLLSSPKFTSDKCLHGLYSNTPLILQLINTHINTLLDPHLLQDEKAIETDSNKEKDDDIKCTGSSTRASIHRIKADKDIEDSKGWSDKIRRSYILDHLIEVQKYLIQFRDLQSKQVLDKSLLNNTNERFSCSYRLGCFNWLDRYSNETISIISTCLEKLCSICKTTGFMTEMEGDANYIRNELCEDDAEEDDGDGEGSISLASLYLSRRQKSLVKNQEMGCCPPPIPFDLTSQILLKTLCKVLCFFLETSLNPYFVAKQGLEKNQTTPLLLQGESNKVVQKRIDSMKKIVNLLMQDRHKSVLRNCKRYLDTNIYLWLFEPSYIVENKHVSPKFKHNKGIYYSEKFAAISQLKSNVPKDTRTNDDDSARLGAMVPGRRGKRSKVAAPNKVQSEKGENKTKGDKHQQLPKEIEQTYKSEASRSFFRDIYH